MDRPPAPAAWADVRGKATNCVRTPGPGPPDGAWGPRVHQDTPLPTSPHLHHQQMPGPGSPILRTRKPLSPCWGTPPALVGDRGVGQGWGLPPVHTLPYQPPGINSRWFCFYFNFFFFGFDFFNKNFHFKHIYTEGICAVYWGELDPELEWGGSWGRGNGSEGAPTLSMSPCPLSPPPQPLPPQFSL